jgi:5,10-methylenetetrahydromethanopterin reductase
MQIGLGVADFNRSSGVDEVIVEVEAARDAGFPSAWVPQLFGADALTLLGVVGQAVGGIELGVAVVPTYSRHPISMAMSSLTASSAAGRGITLGVGVSHRPILESNFGLSFDRPVRHMREYLQVLGPLLRDQRVDFDGDTLRVHAQLDVPGAHAGQLLVAALGPKMLALAGRLAEGTITWMTGIKTVAAHIAPSIAASARAAGRPDPRVVVGLPVCVSSDRGARDRIAEQFASYGRMPSYRAMLEREGILRPGDVAVVGTEAHVREQLAELAESGATDLLASVTGTPAEVEHTRALLQSLI